MIGGQVIEVANFTVFTVPYPHETSGAPRVVRAPHFGDHWCRELNPQLEGSNTQFHVDRGLAAALYQLSERAHMRRHTRTRARIHPVEFCEMEIVSMFIALTFNFAFIFDSLFNTNSSFTETVSGIIMPSILHHVI
jgi:hypothetical protein